MAYYVFVTEDCKKDVAKYGLENEVNKLIEKVLKEQRTSFFQNFPAPYLKKRFSRQERLIASTTSIDESEDTVIVFHRILKRGGNEYPQFIEKPREYGDLYFQPQIDHEELAKWLALERERVKPSEKPVISQDEENFIWHASSQSMQGYSPIESEYFIYESSVWYNSYQNYKSKYGYQSIKSKLADELDEQALTGEGLKQLQLHVTNNDFLLYRIFSDVKIIFLIGIFEKNGNEFLNLPAELKGFLTETNIHENILYRNSLKAYPYFLLIDERWAEIQENNSTNLALSPEEKEVLFDVISVEEGLEKGFPLFLNGRAGSGKSTLLQYLFAEYLGTYLLIRNGFDKKPLYLSYSPQLIEIAEKTVTDILILGHRFEINKEVIETFRREPESCFQTFTGFLKTMLSPEAKERFNDSSYINYPKFIQRWDAKYRNDRNLKSKVNADLCWHVIRTYIKGFNSDSYLDKEDYLELSRAKKSVSATVFDLIFDKVWEGWYKDLTGISGNEWDDLDLVRYILENDLVIPKYASIFCDEAQDFTQVELDLLYRASIYSDRKLSTSTLKRIPIAFAGDQFQTLNPTGFRWDSIRASYTEKFIESLVPWETKRRPTLHYRELRYNYRSQSKIVKVCNTLQAIRKLVFNLEDLEPQECWSTAEHDSPKLVLQEYEAGEYMKDNLGVRIIVPCNLGEEEAYFTEQGFLNSYAPSKDGFPLTVESAMRAKGQEYPEVIVYGFGKYYLEKNFPPVESLIEKGTSQETLLEIEYFFNKLYVALSRARSKLFVIDTDEAKKIFWKLLFDKRAFEKHLAPVLQEHEWSSLCDLLTESSPNEMSSSEVDLIELAVQKEEEGLRKLDPFVLRQAGGLYFRNGNDRKSNYCYGEAAQIQEDYKTAAEYFETCEEFDKAFATYWKAGEYRALLALTEKAKSLQLRIETKFAQLALNPGVDNFQNVCANLNDYCKKSEAKLTYSTDERFKTILQTSLETYLKDSKYDLTQWDRIFTSLDVLANNKIYNADTLMAKVAVKAEQFERAVEIFETNSDFSSKDYKVAKAIILQRKLDENDYQNFTLREKDLAASFLMERKERYDLIAEFTLDVQRIEGRINYIKFEELLRQAIKDKSPVRERVARIYLKCLVSQSKYQRIFSLLKVLQSRFEGHFTILNYFQEERDFWICTLVKEIAISEELPHLIAREQAPVTEFLKSHFLDSSKEIEWNLHPLVVGAAFERAGQYIRSDQFYEKWSGRKDMEYGFSTEVAMRRVKIKSRLAERAKDSENMEQYGKYAAQVSELVKRHGIQADEIPDYPNVAHLLNWSPKPEPTAQIIEEGIKQAQYEQIPATQLDTPLPEPKKVLENIKESTPSQNEVEEVSFIDSHFTVGDISVILDRRNSKIILRNNLTNSDLRYNIQKSKWQIDDELNVITIDEHFSKVDEWSIQYGVIDLHTISITFLKQGFEFRINK